MMPVAMSSSYISSVKDSGWTELDESSLDESAKTEASHLPENLNADGKQTDPYLLQPIPKAKIPMLLTAGIKALSPLTSIVIRILFNEA